MDNPSLFIFLGFLLIFVAVVYFLVESNRRERDKKRHLKLFMPDSDIFLV